MAVREIALLPLEEFGLQVCKTCGERKPLSDFYKSRSGRLGVNRSCKPCECEKAMKWADENRDRVLDAHFRRRFGITLEQYNAMLAEQGGVCAICGEPPTTCSTPGGRRRQGRPVRPRLVVDHDHATGKVRGLLCHACNSGIGNLKDDASIVASALKYLERK